MSTSITNMSDARQAIARFRARAASLRAETQRVTDVGVSAISTVAGGAAAGIVSVKMPTLPGTSVPTDAALGAACVVGSMLGMGGKNNEHLASFGAGMLAVLAAKEAAKMVR